MGLQVFGLVDLTGTFIVVVHIQQFVQSRLPRSSLVLLVVDRLCLAFDCSQPHLGVASDQVSYQITMFKCNVNVIITFVRILPLNLYFPWILLLDDSVKVADGTVLGD